MSHSRRFVISPRSGLSARLGATLVLGLLAGCADQTSSTGVLVQKIYLHEGRGEYAEAIEAITTLIDREPEDAMHYYDRGVFYEAIDDDEAALADYALAIKHAPGHSQALNNRAAILARQGKLDQAILDLDEAIKHGPSDALALRNRGEAYVDLGQFEAALADLNRATELAPSDPVVFFVRGTLYQKQGRLFDALADLTIATHLDPQLESAKVARAEVYAHLQSERLAVQDPAAQDPLEAAPLPDDASLATSETTEESGPPLEAIQEAPAP